ncbi:hypothetical protein L596_005643 [Steinernema carpocapsae]|uniref:RNA exonuclease 4 n=1 Tax=Steinernema carpocapsae TaxID=34508 RepID=A0A4U8V0W8_STECR|nr:hypothetical protein L596_005643 [Steinernema carpocapsae]
MKTKMMSENWKQLQSELSSSQSSTASNPIFKRKNHAPINNKWKKQKEYIAGMSKDSKRAKQSTSGILDLEELKKSSKKVFAIDCEYVGAGFEGKDDILARVSIVDEEGNCVYDKYVFPTKQITDYRTDVSGIRPADLCEGKAESFDKVQQDVKAIMEGNIIVGHGFHNDLRVLQVSHPKSKTRDTAKFKPIQKACGVPGKTPSLKLVAQKLLCISIQSGEHSSVEDAKICMAAYRLYKANWESIMKKKF